MIMPKAPLSNDFLLKYLEGKLDAMERVRIEQALSEDPFLADALEGLAKVEDKQQLPFIVGQLNARLRRQINKRKKRQRPLLKQPLWIYVLLILLLAFVGWMVFSSIPK